MISPEKEALVASLQNKYTALRPVLDERTRRLWAATEAKQIGHGGIRLVQRATGMAMHTIRTGLRELEQMARNTQAKETSPTQERRVRRPGAGRKPLTQHDPALLVDLESLIEPSTRGDPESPLRWSSKSLHKIKTQLQAKGYKISHQSVSTLLHRLGYSLQANRKTREGSSHPDRDAQFCYINERTQAYLTQQQPVISVDCKKKELVGAFKNAGREWRPKGEPEEVAVHDFLDKELGKAIPYGVYDVAANAGWVSVGVDHDTAAFAVATILRWWEQVGKALYPKATALQILADGGGSNASRSRLWKASLQSFADTTGLLVHVCHFPPGTSKWNKIEHRMFSFISLNWRGRPLVSHEVILSLIGSTTTRTGLRIQAALDSRPYPTKIRVSDADLAGVNLQRHAFHGEWNYTIHPRQAEPLK